MPFFLTYGFDQEKPPSPRTQLAMMRLGISKSDVKPPVYDEVYLKYRDRAVADNFLQLQYYRYQQLVEMVNEECKRITDYGVSPEEFEFFGRPQQLERYLIYNMTLSQLSSKNDELLVKQVENNAKRAQILVYHHAYLQNQRVAYFADQKEAEKRKKYLYKYRERELSEKSEQRQEKWQQIQSYLASKEDASERRRYDTLKKFYQKVYEQQNKIAQYQTEKQKQSNKQFYEEYLKIKEYQQRDKELELERQRAFWEYAKNAYLKQYQLEEQQRIEKEERFLRHYEERYKAEYRLAQIEYMRIRAYLEQYKAFNEKYRQAEELREKREREQRKALQQKADSLNERISEYRKRRDSLEDSITSQKSQKVNKTLTQFERIEQERRETYQLLTRAKAENEAKIEQTLLQAQMTKRREEYYKKLAELKLDLKLYQIDEFKKDRERLCQKHTEHAIRLNSLSEEERLRVSYAEAEKLRKSSGLASAQPEKKYPRVEYTTKSTVRIVEQPQQPDKRSRGTYAEKLELQAKIEHLRKQQIQEMDKMVEKYQKREQEMKRELEQAIEQQAKIQVLLDHKMERKQMCAEMNKLREDQNQELKYYLYLLEHRYSGVSGE